VDASFSGLQVFVQHPLLLTYASPQRLLGKLRVLQQLAPGAHCWGMLDTPVMQLTNKHAQPSPWHRLQVP
jgi:hypothetical protein